MKSIKKTSVKSHRKTLEASRSAENKPSQEDPITASKKAFSQNYSASGSDKHGCKTEPSPNTTHSIKFFPKNGAEFGFPYAYLQHWYFEQEKTALILIFSLGVVKISGGNLDELFQLVSEYKVKEIYVTEKTMNPNVTTIESIIVERNKEVKL